MYIRPFFSSLLEALPQRTWSLREDAHECREAAYIAEVEGSLLYSKGQMVLHLVKHFLQTKTDLNKDKIIKVSLSNSYSAIPECGVP